MGSSVLLVDDDEHVLTAHGRILKRAGFEVERADSGKRALEMLAAKKFDVVVTDVRMPSMDGVELLREIRARDADLPVILLTGALTVESAAMAINLGIMKCLLKPVPAVELVSTLTRAVSMHRLGVAKREALRAMSSTMGEASSRVTLELTFQRTLDSLWLAFQPIVKMNGGLFGFEALMRSREPLLPHPGAVLDAAERLQALPTLARTIRRLAIDALPRAPKEAALFVNLHPRDLLDDELYRALAERPDAQRFVFELTERSSLEEVDGITERVARLRELGCRIAIDDLGAGYAGLASFVALEPELVKLDIALVRDCDKSPLKRKLIRSLTSVCEELGVLVVAEGIETAEEKVVLAELGCQLAQGYLFGRPREEFVEYVGR
ncbi:MAG: EAL domain-containing protein [Myxococcota bacterium]